MILGTAGHIDHGKTTLVKALTGVDTDRLPEEKRRGITIDLGFAPLAIDGAATIGIVDVPGHEAFIRTMLAGASGIDIALLVIAADESVMPQTREHLEILSLLGIDQLIVAITKSDVVADDWMTLVLDDVETLLAATVFRGSRVVPVSARTGEGIADLRRAISDAALSVPSRGPDNDLFRMPIDRIFTIRGTGTVVTGTIWSGSVSRDAALILRPGDRTVRVRGVQTHGAGVVTANAGERAAIALAGCELADVGRGSVLVGDAVWIGTDEIEADIELAAISPRITSRTRLRFHLGTADVGCRLAGARTIGGTAAAEHGRVRIVFDEPLVSRGGDRFVLRYPSPPTTIGGGRVVDPYPPKRRRNARAEEDVPSSGGANLTESMLGEMLAAAGAAGIQLSTLPVRLGVSMDSVAAAATAIGAITIDGRTYSEKEVSAIADSLSTAISGYAANFPLEPGVSLQTLRSFVRAGPGVIDLALGRLAEENRIVLDRALARPAGWAPRLDSAEQALSDSILHEICIQPNEPPGVQELGARFGSKASSLLRKLERDGEVVRVSDGRYYSRSAVSDIVGLLKSKLVPGRAYSPAELREILGVSRKYLIPMLEFCDRTGVTERSSEGRALVVERAQGAQDAGAGAGVRPGRPYGSA